MGPIEDSIRHLISQVGSVALAHLPGLESIKVLPHEDDKQDTLDFKIAYGLSDTDDGEPPRQVNITLNTVANKKQHELGFLVEAGSGDDSSSEYILITDVGKIVASRSSAFEGVKTKEKIRALARYYFLLLMKERKYDGSELKHPFPINNAFVTSLKGVCKDFENLHKSKAPEVACALLSNSRADSPATEWGAPASKEQLHNFYGQRLSINAKSFPVRAKNGQSNISTKHTLTAFQSAETDQLSMSSEEDDSERANFPNLTVPSVEVSSLNIPSINIPSHNVPGAKFPIVDASARTPTMNVAPFADMLGHGHVSRQELIDTYNDLRNAGLELKAKDAEAEKEQQKLAKELKEIDEMRAAKQDKMNALRQQQMRRAPEAEKVNAKKRKMLEKLSGDELEDFLYKAGHSAKRPRN